MIDHKLNKATQGVQSQAKRRDYVYQKGSRSLQQTLKELSETNIYQDNLAYP